jgi:ABC-type sugar transport system substrate-binding protein
MKLSRILTISGIAAAAAVAGTALVATPSADAQGGAASFGPANAKETYYWISQNSTLPLFVRTDYPGMKKAADQLKIRIRVAGPTTIDLNAFIATINQVCAQKPAGVSVVGWDPSLSAAVDKCMDQGVPTVVDDADLPNSKRMTFIGTDWYQIGVQQGRAMVKATGGKGKVAMISIINADNMKAAVRGFQDTVKGKLEIVANEDDGGDASKAATVVASLIAANTDLVGIAGFDSESGAGAVRAIAEAKKTGQIKVTAMEQTPEFFKTIKDGSTEAIIVQKRELFTYYAFKTLYDFKHNNLTVNGLTGFVGSPVPRNIDTGLLVVDKSNIEEFLKGLGVK